jgi:hypothetical protein
MFLSFFCLLFLHRCDFILSSFPVSQENEIFPKKKSMLAHQKTPLVTVVTLRCATTAPKNRSTFVAAPSLPLHTRRTTANRTRSGESCLRQSCATPSLHQPPSDVPYLASPVPSWPQLAVAHHPPPTAGHRWPQLAWICCSPLDVAGLLVVADQRCLQVSWGRGGGGLPV